MSFTEKTKLEAKRKSHFRCCVCRHSFVEVHHIIPTSRGGSDDLDNAATLCASCHDLFGGNPDKRKQIREMRDQWWELMEQKEKLIFTSQDLDEGIIELEEAPHKKLKKKAVALYHVVFKNENFETSANILFDMVKHTQKYQPNTERHLYLDIEGHKNKKGGFDHDMFELQKDFVLGFLLKYLSKVSMPLVRVKNENQTNDIPDKLMIFASKEDAEKFKRESKDGELTIFDVDADTRDSLK